MSRSNNRNKDYFYISIIIDDKLLPDSTSLIPKISEIRGSLIQSVEYVLICFVGLLLFVSKHCTPNPTGCFMSNKRGTTEEVKTNINF